jgi:hypothetical protein
MSVPTQATDALRELKAELTEQEPMKGGLDSVLLSEKIRAVRRLLAKEGDQWIGTAEAKRLLGASSGKAVKAWARSGRLRSRTLPHGRLQVLLDDVLHQREVTEGLTAIDRGEDISQAELDQLMRYSPPLYPGGPGFPYDRQDAPSVTTDGAAAP